MKRYINTLKEEKVRSDVDSHSVRQYFDTIFYFV